MIVCKRCGNHNAAGDSFCASCGAFLEWEGEQIVEAPAPVAQPSALPPPQIGIVQRIKHAVIGDGATEQPGQPGPSGPSGPSGLPGPGQQGPGGGFGAPRAGYAPPQSGQSGQSGQGAAGSGFLPPPTSGQGSATPRVPTVGAHGSPGQNPALSSLVAKPVPQTETNARTPQARPQTNQPQPAGPTDPSGPGDRQPSAQMPTAASARPKPVSMQPPSREIKPGDLVCGNCGEGNDPERKFCRRCGTSLAEIVPVKLTRRQRRAQQKAAKKSPGFQAGDRPMRAGGKGGDMAKGARQVKGGLLGNLAKVGKVLAILAVVGVGGGMLIPSVRGTITSKASGAVTWVRRKVNPQFVEISPDKTLITATSSAPGHDAAFAADGVKNDSWIGATDAKTATVTIVFKQETLAKILVTPGDQSAPAAFKLQPRPKDMFVSAVDAKGKVVASRQVTLTDKADPQSFDFGAKNIVKVSFTVQSCYPDPALQVCAISEIEFFKQK